MKPKPLIIAIHGILTGQTTTSWPQRFEQFVEDQAALPVITKTYLGGPFPMLNVWLLNRILAREVLAALNPWLELPRPPRLCFVAHSNGCDVALKTIRALAKRGIPTHSFVATGAAIEADVEKNGIADLLGSGMLSRAVAYCSKRDRAVASRFIWPYGHLGRTGWLIDGAPANGHDPRLITRFFDGFGHSTYFDEKHRTNTFHALLTDATT